MIRIWVKEEGIFMVVQQKGLIGSLLVVICDELDLMLPEEETDE